MKKTFVTFIIVFILIAVAALSLYLMRFNISKQVTVPIETETQGGVPLVVGNQGEPKEDIEVLIENLEIPWEIAFLPNGEMLITERPGRVLKIGAERKVIEVGGVSHVGEGGLLGLVLHPDFERNNLVYLYYTTEEGGRLVNRVERYRFVNDNFTNREVILEGIRGAANHDGGRIAFGPDNLLYIATGDAQESNLAQNRDSLNGKILRIQDDGSIPSDNPFGSAVFSWGHRNVQGLAWDEDGRLWATEHGPSGIQSGFDELNLVEKGQNYGWPTIQGTQQRTGMVSPVINSGSNDTWAPSGAAYYEGNVFFAGLRGEALYQAKISGTRVTELKRHFEEEYGRLRTVKLGPDGYLYILTNNRDGRGSPNEGDDKLIRVNPKILQ